MLHAMSRIALGLAFAVVALAPFAVACDMLNRGDGADAAADAPIAVTPPIAPTTAAPAVPDTATPAVTPLGGAVAPTPGTKPVAVVDGGKPADAGAVVIADAGTLADGGKAAPVPTPTFTIPTSFPGFDAGAFKPPPGFPSTLPTFPPPQPQPTK